MCGITGYLSYSNFFEYEDLKKMNACISHRGPDAEGYFSDEYCGLAHSRLSILDLSERANQPMKSSNGRYIIIYNGEVYNYSEIGAGLKENPLYSGKIFKTSSDTEVILEAFMIYGTDFIYQLNGMFAIAIYDSEQNELYLFRDRIGIKPVFYYWDGINFAFASELKALQSLNKLKLDVNEHAIPEFLHMGMITAPHSIYKNIYKILPGAWIHVSRKGITNNTYWSLKQKLSKNLITNKDQALVKLSDLIISSVQYQMKSDVPFGVFLSGGIDSSLLTAQAVSLSSVKVNTFSIGFEENSHNESQYAKAVANYLGTHHHEFIVSYKDAIELIDTIFDTYDEPFSDPSSIPTMLVSKLAKQYVTVTLSGEGGDELFLGYGAYAWARRLNNPLYKIGKLPLSMLFSYMTSRYQRIGKMLDTRGTSDIRKHIFSQEQYYFTTSEIDELLVNPNIRHSSENENWGKVTVPGFNNINVNTLEVGTRKLSKMEQQAMFDMQYYLPDDLLTKVDRASMRFGLETRVPYLDHRVVEFALNLSPQLKYHKGISKYILKQILYQYLPPHFFNRPKQGFAIPLNKWLRNELKYLIEENLNENVIRQSGIVKYEVVKKLKDDFLFGKKDYLYTRLWLLIVLHKWLPKHTI